MPVSVPQVNRRGQEQERREEEEEIREDEETRRVRYRRVTRPTSIQQQAVQSSYWNQLLQATGLNSALELWLLHKGVTLGTCGDHA